jgi:hypothetical protein
LKQFIKDSFIFLIPLILCFVIFIYAINGYTDNFYLKVSSPKQESLILGNSRALQGINPVKMDSVLDDNSFFNFAFTMAHSPYGKVYLKAIKQKIENESSNNIYIVTIDPWSISSKIENFENENLFRENDLFLNQIDSYSSYPNLEYIFNYIDTKDVLIGIARNHNLVGHSFFLNKRGWLKIEIPMDSLSIEKRTSSKLNTYRGYIDKYKLSTIRLKYLIETVKFLKGKGDVYLVRLPISPEMIRIENDFEPKFDSIIDGLSEYMQVPYFNCSNLSSDYKFTDGNHLYHESSNTFSKDLANMIRNQKN